YSDGDAALATGAALRSRPSTRTLSPKVFGSTTPAAIARTSATNRSHSLVEDDRRTGPDTRGTLRGFLVLAGAGPVACRSTCSYGIAPVAPSDGRTGDRSCCSEKGPRHTR